MTTIQKFPTGTYGKGTPNAAPTPNKRNARISHETRRRVGGILGVVAAAALAVGGIVGLAEASKKSVEGTHFPDVATAVATLQASADKHGDDMDNFGPDQGKMEKDLRGANPVIMKDLGQKVMSTAKGHEGQYKLANGQTLAIYNSKLDNGNSDLTIDVTDTKSLMKSELSLEIKPDGTFEELRYESGDMPESGFIGGPEFTYGFAGNDYENSNTYQHADGTPVGEDGGAAIIVNNTYFSPYMAAGPATHTALTDYQHALHMVEETEHLAGAGHVQG